MDNLCAPSSGCTAASSSCSCSSPYSVLTAAPAPSPSESGPGMGSPLLAGSSPARTRMPNLAFCDAPAYRLAATKPATTRHVDLPAPRWVSFSDPVVSTPSCSEQSSEHFGTVFLPPCGGVFARPRPAAPSRPPQLKYPQCKRKPPVRIDL